MSSPQSPAGGPAGRLPGESLTDPVVPPAEINGSSSDRGDRVVAPGGNVAAEVGGQSKAQQVRAQAAAKAAQLRGQAVEKAPQVRAPAVETAQQIRVRAAERAPHLAQGNQGKAVAALVFGLLVLWLRRRWNRRSSRTAGGVAAAVDEQARSLVGDTGTALSAEAASTGRTQNKAQRARGRAAVKAQARAQAIEKAQQARTQAIEKAQQARAQAIEKAQQLREQATEKAQAAEKARQAAQEAQQLVQALKQRLPRR
jgi:colicin import membrane protein